jgi:hypothetical protein
MRGFDVTARARLLRPKMDRERSHTLELGAMRIRLVMCKVQC